MPCSSTLARSRASTCARERSSTITESTPWHDGRRPTGPAAEIGEVLLDTAVYAGVPTANRALAVASEALSSEDDADTS